MKYWLFNRDPFIGLLQSIYNWVVFHPLYTPNNQVFFIAPVKAPIKCNLLILRTLKVRRCVRWGAWQIHSISLRIQTCPYSRIDGLNMSQSHPQNRIQDVVPSFGSAWILKVWIPIQIAGWFFYTPPWNDPLDWPSVSVDLQYLDLPFV